MCLYFLNFDLQHLFTKIWLKDHLSYVQKLQESLQYIYNSSVGDSDDIKTHNILTEK